MRALLILRRVGVWGALFRVLWLLAVATLLRWRRIGPACCWGLWRVALVG